MFELHLVGQVLVAIILGGLLGYQRERLGKSAGVRTYALVAAGATLFTVMSLHAFGYNTSYVAAQIITGIGFLGAGTILHKENRVEGLTTAAGLWLAAAIGMAVGVGYYVLAVIVAVLMFVVLLFDDSRFKKDQNLQQ